MDRIHARWTPNDAFYMDLGRQGVALDQTGVFWDEDGRFDGVVAGYDNGKFGAELVMAVSRTLSAAWIPITGKTVRPLKPGMAS